VYVELWRRPNSTWATRIYPRAQLLYFALSRSAARVSLFGIFQLPHKVYLRIVDVSRHRHVQVQYEGLGCLATKTWACQIIGMPIFFIRALAILESELLFKFQSSSKFFWHTHIFLNESIPTFWSGKF
jgi:hypothetical protein